VWVDANFKEPQLATMRIGQSVTLKADLYGNKIAYHGTVSGFGAGTGSAFSLLPAQNATGNWIKIVQRVPVRIALDPQELALHPLQIGLSMQVDIDTHQRDGVRLPQQTKPATAYRTDVYDSVDATAAQRIRSIIAANGQLNAKSDTTATASLRTPKRAATDTTAPARHVAAGPQSQIR
jgi:membrane fusion protein (multidrug efflux system)